MGQTANFKPADVKSVSSVPDVLAELDRLNEALPTSQLQALATFNAAYYIVTSVIKQATDAGRFVNPEFIETFSVRFAIYYFQAINDFLSGGSDLVPAWAQTMQPASKRPNFVSLLMGANAHINYDLPLALLEVMDDGKKPGVLKDLIKIDNLLMKSGKQILDTFDEPNKLLNFAKRNLRFIYFSPAMHMILFWRVMTWRNYKKLKSPADDVRLLRRSSKISKRFIKLGKIL